MHYSFSMILMILRNSGLRILVSFWLLFTNAISESEVARLKVTEKSNIPADIKEIVNVKCIPDKYGMGYIGSQNITYDGLPCIQWALSHILYKRYKLKGKNIPENYCRNPNGDITGPWCLVYTKNSSIRTRRCGIPLCQSKIGYQINKIQVGFRMIFKRECPFGFEEKTIKGPRHEKYSYCVVKQEFLSKLPTGKYSLKLTNEDNSRFCPNGFEIEENDSLLREKYCTRTDATSDMIEFPKYLTPKSNELIFVAVKLGANSKCPKMSGKAYVISRVLDFPQTMFGKTYPGKVTNCHYVSNASKNTAPGSIDRRLGVFVLQNKCPKNWPVRRRFLVWQFAKYFVIHPKNACMPKKDVMNYPAGNYCLLSLDSLKGENRQCPEEFIDVDIKLGGSLETKFCCTQSGQLKNSNEKIYDFFNASSLMIINSEGECEKISKKGIIVKQYTMELVSLLEHECTNCDLFKVFVKQENDYSLPSHRINYQINVCSYELETNGFAYATLNGRCPLLMNFGSIKYRKEMHGLNRDEVLSLCTILNYPKNISFPEGRYCIYKMAKDCPLGFQIVKSEPFTNFYKYSETGEDIINFDMNYYCCKFGPRNISFENATLPYVEKYFEFGLPYGNSSFNCVYGLATHKAIEDSKMCQYYPITGTPVAAPLTSESGPLVNWPIGSYIFFKPINSICPFGFDEGAITFRSFYNIYPKYIYPLMFGSLKNEIYSYCKRNSSMVDKLRPAEDWPPGNYCLIFETKCPPGMLRAMNHSFRNLIPRNTFGAQMAQFSILCCKNEKLSDPRTMPYFPGDLYSFIIQPIRDHRACPPHQNARVALVDLRTEILCIYERLDESVEFPDGDYLLPAPEVPINACAPGFKLVEHRHLPQSKYHGSANTLKFCQKEKNAPNNATFPRGNYCVLTTNSICPTSQFTIENMLYIPFSDFADNSYKSSNYLACCQKDKKVISNIANLKVPFVLYSSSSRCSYVDGLLAVWESVVETVFHQQIHQTKPPFDVDQRKLRICKYNQINGLTLENGFKCHPNASYNLFLKDNNCQCLPGYFGDGKTFCDKITNETDNCANRCDKQVSNCSKSMTSDAYSCVCKEGYEFSGFTCIPTCNTKNCKAFSSCVKNRTETLCTCDHDNTIEADNGECHRDLVTTMYYLPGFDYLRQLNLSCFSNDAYYHLMESYVSRLLFIFFPINKKDFSICDHYYYGFSRLRIIKNGTSLRITIRMEKSMSILVTKNNYNVWMLEDEFKVLNVDVFINAVVLYMNFTEDIEMAFTVPLRRRAINGFVIGGILLFVLSIIFLFIINSRRHVSIFGRLFEKRRESAIHFTTANDRVEIE